MDRIPPSPQPWPETEPFWTAANDGRLLLKRCRDTGRAFFYPRDHSPFTGGDTEWIEASGHGVIYSFSVLARAQPPYCLAYVTLAEGPIVLTNLITADFDSLYIGQPVTVTFVASQNGQKVPMFTPI
jgi:uncharacterized OB-fold protein